MAADLKILDGLSAHRLGSSIVEKDPAFEGVDAIPAQHAHSLGNGEFSDNAIATSRFR